MVFVFYGDVISRKGYIFRDKDGKKAALTDTTYIFGDEERSETYKY